MSVARHSIAMQKSIKTPNSSRAPRQRNNLHPSSPAEHSSNPPAHRRDYSLSEIPLNLPRDFNHVQTTSVNLGRKTAAIATPRPIGFANYHRNPLPTTASAADVAGSATPRCAEHKRAVGAMGRGRSRQRGTRPKELKRCGPPSPLPTMNVADVGDSVLHIPSTEGSGRIER